MTEKLQSAPIVAVVAHDAGGAEILASFVRKHSSYKFRFALTGPAVNVFQRCLGTLEIESLHHIVPFCEWCLCGSSGVANTELDAIQMARLFGKKSVVYLDHWINYRERFTRNGVVILPDEIYVGDREAQEIAQKQFPDTKILFVENPYFAEIRRRINDIVEIGIRPKRTEKTILFVSENLSSFALDRYSDVRYFGYTEFDAISYLIKNFYFLCDSNCNIAIRPHPSDPVGKYDRFISLESPVVRLSSGGDLLHEIFCADFVVGCQSMAMVVGLIANKIVVESIPPEGGASALPHLEIRSLKKIVCSSKYLANSST